MKSPGERYAGWPLIIGIIVAVLALTAGPALAALTFSGTGISGDGAVVIDSSSTISIGTSTATGVTIGNNNGTTSFLGKVAIGGPASDTYSPDDPFDTTHSTLAVTGALAGVDDNLEQYGGVFAFNIDPTTNNDDAFHGLDVQLSTPATDSQDSAGYLYAFESDFIHNGSGAINGPVYGVNSDVENDGSGHIDTMYGYTSNLGNSGTGNVGQAFGYYAYSPITGGPLTPFITQFYSEALGGTAVNAYSFWDDEQGVFRIKADNHFNGVYQAIPALYNPLFTKYTPGAADYERLTLGEWNNNIAEIGTENSGSGIASALAFITASTTRMTIGATGNVGIGTSVPSTTLQVIGASSTIRIGNSALPGCLEIGNSDGSAGINYITDLNGVLTSTTTKPTNCQ